MTAATTRQAQYTHGYHSSVLRSHSNRTIANSARYVQDALRPGLSLLDVGSGVGTITAEFAQRLAPGRVTALEVTQTALDLSRAEIRRHGLSNVDFVLADVHSLALADDRFDIVHAHQVLQHVQDPVQALREMRRVCKPGGIVAVRDADYGGFIWYPELPALDQWRHCYQQAARANGGEPNAGRHLLSWARQAGLADITATSSTWCLATSQARAWWGGMWAERILQSKMAAQLRSQGLAQQQDLERIAQAWREWAAAEDGWLSIPHAELLCCA